MQIKTGIDIIEIDRIKQAIEKFDQTFLQTIFTQKEIQYCESHKMQKYQHYAARFAGKEAIFKALSSYYTECKWKEFEILNDEKGRPFINLKNNNIKISSIDISISHCQNYAVANVTALID